MHAHGCVSRAWELGAQPLRTQHPHACNCDEQAGRLRGGIVLNSACPLAAAGLALPVILIAGTRLAGSHSARTKGQVKGHGAAGRGGRHSWGGRGAARAHSALPASAGAASAGMRPAPRWRRRGRSGRAPARARRRCTRPSCTAATPGPPAPHAFVPSSGETGGPGCVRRAPKGPLLCVSEQRGSERTSSSPAPHARQEQTHLAVAKYEAWGRVVCAAPSGAQLQTSHRTLLPASCTPCESARSFPSACIWSLDWLACRVYVLESEHRAQEMTAHSLLRCALYLQSQRPSFRQGLCFELLQRVGIEVGQLARQAGADGVQDGVG